MLLYLLGHTYKYECEKICRIYFPTEKILFAENEDVPADGEDKLVYTAVEEKDGSVVFSCRVLLNGREDAGEAVAAAEKCPTDPDREKELARVMTDVLTRLTGLVPPWGILTGVRPSKLMRKYVADFGEEKAKELFTSFLKVTPTKTHLALNVAKAEDEGVALSKPDSFSLYISIPFCPTRCSYCSFVSHSIESAKKLIPDYVRLLCEEIKQTSAIARELHLWLETVYIGGGTPTSLAASDLEKICAALNENFDMKSAREFTVEAGRPDTIDEKKLRVLKAAGVDRISINPQTFSDRVLENIGRRHTSADILEKFALARSLGFDNINMDFIAGLTEDTPEGFKASLDKAIELSPENITVHTLALKSSSTLVTSDETDRVCRDTAEMVDYANAALYAAGYTPYYMYRQSKSVGNLENVGWCKEGKACLYNIYMMEEIHTVLACGGGAVTKLRSPYDTTLERIYNFKYPYEYIGRFEEQSARKDEIVRFYRELSVKS